MELCHRFRPKKLADVYGQQEAVEILRVMKRNHDIPRALMFHGPSGTGKTTMARIVASWLSKYAICEINCSAKDPLKTVQQVEETARRGTKTIFNEAYVWILEEYQTLSRSKAAQEACLKPFEDAENNYFIITTTEPNRIIDTVRNRCQAIRCSPVKASDMRLFLLSILKRAGKSVASEVIDQIIDIADGSPRKSLKLLDSVYRLEGVKKQLKSLVRSDGQVESFKFVQALCRPGARWVDVAPILKQLENEDAEGLRRFVLKYAGSMILNTKFLAGSKRAYEVIEAFRDHTYDSGMPALRSMAYGVCK